MNIAVVTTFPNNMWDVYAKQMLQSFVQYWPQEIPLLVQLDDDLLYPELDKILRPQDGIAVGRNKDHADFVARNKDKDHPTDYRQQPVRFCHKVFALHRAMEAALKQGETEAAARYLIWMDADVITTRQVTLGDITKCLPKEGDAVAYLGRKDWDHSECGWLAFDLENGGDRIILDMYDCYVDDSVLRMKQQHDSWVFDKIINPGSNNIKVNVDITNLTKDKPGTEIWEQSPMSAWSKHYKGPRAKQELYGQKSEQVRPQKGQNFVIQTKNAIPHEEIRRHITENQELIKNWITECEDNNEEIVVVSAGPSLIAEDVREEVKAGRKIVAVKHALQPLKAAGIKPWACILLDPRPHVAEFVKEADPDIKWFIATQVNPEVTKALLAAGCEVWGYHAAVGAEETDLTNKQPLSVISGGSATATRGLYVLNHLGFKSFRLYGYELAYPDKPDLAAKDTLGQPKYMEFSLGVKTPHLEQKRSFYSEPQLIAQYEEINQIINGNKFTLKAFGEGMVPFLLKMTETARLRQDEIKCKMGGKISSYKRLFKCSKTKKTRSLQEWLKISLPTLHKLTVKNKL